MVFIKLPNKLMEYIKSPNSLSITYLLNFHFVFKYFAQQIEKTKKNIVFIISCTNLSKKGKKLKTMK